MTFFLQSQNKYSTKLKTPSNERTNCVDNVPKSFFLKLLVYAQNEKRRHLIRYYINVVNA